MNSTATDVRVALTPDGDATDTTTAASLSDEQLEDAIREADGTIAFLLARYDLTASEARETVEQGDPPESIEVAVAPVRYWSRDIAAYLATLTFKRNKDVTPDDPIRLRYLQVMAMLMAVNEGKVSLPLPEGDDSDAGAYVINLYEGTMFGPEDFLLIPAPLGGYPRSLDYVWPSGLGY